MLFLSKHLRVLYKNKNHKYGMIINNVCIMKLLLLVLLKKLANIFSLFRKTLNLMDSLKFNIFVLIGSQNSRAFFHANIGILHLAKPSRKNWKFSLWDENNLGAFCVATIGFHKHTTLAMMQYWHQRLYYRKTKTITNYYPQ